MIIMVPVQISVARTNHGHHAHAGRAMQCCRSWSVLLLVLLVAPSLLLAQSSQRGVAPATIETRLSRVERVLGSESLLNLASEVAQLRREVRMLRGQIEVQQHNLKQLEARQEQLASSAQNNPQTNIEVNSADAATSAAGDTPSREIPTPETRESMPASALQLRLDTPASSQETHSQNQSAGGLPNRGSDSPAALTSAGALTEQNAYQDVFEHFKQRRYSRAAGDFERFISRYPDGPYSDNAQYWLAESHYALGKLDQAMAEFETLRTRFPNSSKVPLALLKIGYIYDEQGNSEQARAVLKSLIDKFPSTTAAGLASQRIERIR